MPVCDSDIHLMQATAPPAAFKKRRMGFNLEIVLAVFSIMALSQTMGALFSALSFEEVYLSAMTSKYEILGKDLKRKIELALKFGKRLDRFIGIEKLMDPIIRQAADVDDIFICDNTGKLLHTSKTSSFSKCTGILSMDSSRLNRPAEPSATSGTAARLHFAGGSYFLFFPLSAPYGDRQGILGLSFSRAALDQKKRLLMHRTFLHLGLSGLLTAVTLFLLIEYGFSRPLTRWVRRNIPSAESEDSLATPSSGPLELRELHEQISAYVHQNRTAHKELTAVLDEIEGDPRRPARSGPAIQRMKRILEGKTDEAD